jgi:predicted acylesterase/phospholipase RssA/CRP-like cAMP-binding protein
MNAPAFEILRKEAVSLSFGAGETIFRAGDTADSIYIVLEGRLRFEAPRPEPGPPELLAELVPGEWLGEVALMRGLPHTASAAASGPVRVIQIRKYTLDRMLAVDSQLGRKLLDRASRHMVSARLSSVPLLADIAHGAGSSLDLESNWIRLKPGESLFREGDVPDFVYVLVSGRLEVLASGTGEPVDLLAPGACIGDLELLSGETRHQTVRALRASELVRIARGQFEILLQNQPRTADRIARRIVEGVKSTVPPRAGGRANISVIVCIPAGAGEACRRFISDLGDAVARCGKTAVLSRRGLEALRGSELPDQSASESARLSLTDWITDQERDNRYVLAECDTRHTLWNEVCLAQADLVLVLVDADGDPATGELENSLYTGAAAPGARWELVLLHRSRSTTPRGTSRHLAVRPSSGHHHVVTGSRADAGHMARLITGNAVGIVFSGGGIRSFSQIGVLKALREIGTPVDMTGGTGTGAIIAALHSMGQDPEAVAEAYGRILRKGFGRAKVSRHLAPALAGLLSGRALVDALRSVFGDLEVEDLWLPCFSVAASLTDSRQKIQDSGLLWLTERAAVSVAGILPPVWSGSEWLVDGSVVNPVPADVMRRRCNGISIAVDARGGAPHPIAGRKEPLAAASGWSLFWKGLVWRKSRPPRIFETLFRAAEMRTTEADGYGRPAADIYLRPQVDGIGTFEWKRAGESLDTGYRRAMEEFTRPGLVLPREHPEN